MKSEPLKFNRKDWLSVLSVTALILGMLYFGAPVWIPLVFAFFLFMILDPLVTRFERRGFSGPLISLFLVILSAVAITGGLWAGYVSVRKIALNVPQYESRLKELRHELLAPRDSVERSEDFLLHGPEQVNPRSDRIQKVEVVSDPSAFLFSSPLWSGVNSALGIIAVIFFIPIITLMLLWERRALYSRLESLFAHPDVFRTTCRKLRRMTYGFFFGNFVVGVGMSALFSMLYLVLGLDDFLLYGFVSGFLNLLPVFGPIFGSFLPVVQALIQFPVFWPAWLILAASILIHFLSANLLIPKFIGRRVNLNATAGTVGLLVWAALWGVMGLFLAIPLTAAIRIVLEIFPNTRRYAGLLEELETVPLRPVEKAPVGTRAEPGISFAPGPGKA